MIKTVLVVCVGNICRSPLGERLLQTHAPHLAVTSAGIGALVGNAADASASAVATGRGVTLDGHVARQFVAELGRSADLILVMEAGHKAQIARDTPQLSGKTMLFDHWTGARGIADPYQKSHEFHELVFDQIEAAAKAWSGKLTSKGAV
jgi:protein-tyrosine phosphatase